MPLIVAICGQHNSGKTTVGTFLVRELKNLGYQIAVVKSTKEEGYLTDHPGSDTFRYRESGADVVCLFQRELFTLYTSKLPEKESLIEFLNSLFWDKDLILLEGFKGFTNISKIWVLREDEDESEIKKNYSGIELCIRKGEEKKALNFLLEKLREKKEDEVFLYINGKEVFLKPFVQRILKEILLGFLKGLKGIPEKISYLEIKIKKE